MAHVLANCEIVMSVHQMIKGVMQDAEKSLLQALQHGSSSWVDAIDDDGNNDTPDNERQVLVFLCGDRSIVAERPSNAGYGLRFGFFDHEKQCWMVSGKRDAFVTHWMECPAAPLIGVRNCKAG